MHRTLLLLYPASKAHLKVLQSLAPDWMIYSTTDRAEALQYIAQAEVVMGNHHLTESLPYSNATLKWIQTNSVGADYILQQCGHLLNNVQFTNARGVYDDEMSEHAMALLLHLQRQLHTIGLQQQQQLWLRPHQMGTLKSKKILLLGYGSLGKSIAQKLQAFKVELYGANSTQCFKIENNHHQILPIHWKALLPEIDVLVMILPLTPATKNMVGFSELLLLPKSAILINIGRAGTLDENALFNLLESDQLKAAALDVFETEPLPPQHQSWSTKNLFISPHMSRSRETHPPFTFEPLFEENFNRYLTQQPLLNIVDIKKGY